MEQDYSPKAQPPDAREAPADLDERTRASLAHCHQIARTRARNFYYGLKLTPEPKRSAVYAVYAFMRACDDMADDASDPQQAAECIEAFRGKMQAVLDDPEAPLPDGDIWPAFRHVTQTYAIDSDHLHHMLDAQRTDLVKQRYETFDELYDYCYKVASVVGLVCIQIWGHDGSPAVQKLAEHRGIALQLTNILRDLAEDGRRGRIYLPLEDLKRFDIDEEALLAGQMNEAFDEMMRYQIDRAWHYYRAAAPLEPHIHAACRPTSWAMMQIYRGLLDRITRDPRRVMQQRVSLGAIQKVAIAVSAAWKSSRVGDGQGNHENV